MKRLLIKALAAFSFIASIAAVLFRSQAKAQMQKAETEEHRADAAESVIQKSTQLQSKLSSLREQQRQEQIDAKTSTGRDDFNNSW